MVVFSKIHYPYLYIPFEQATDNLSEDDPAANPVLLAMNPVTFRNLTTSQRLAAMVAYCEQYSTFADAGLTSVHNIARQYYEHIPNWLAAHPPLTDAQIEEKRAEKQSSARAANSEGRNAELAEDNAELREDRNTYRNRAAELEAEKEISDLALVEVNSDLQTVRAENELFRRQGQQVVQDLVLLKKERDALRLSLIESDAKVKTLEAKMEAEKETSDKALAEVKADRQRLLKEAKEDKDKLAALNDRIMEIQQANTSIMSNNHSHNIDSQADVAKNLVNTQVGYQTALLNHTDNNLSTYYNTFMNMNASGIAQDNNDANELDLDSEEVIKRYEVENSTLKTDLEETKAALERKTEAVNDAEVENSTLKTDLEETKAALELKTEAVNELNGRMTDRAATIIGLRHEMTQSTNQKVTTIEKLKSLVASKTSQILALEFEKSLLVPTNPPKQTGIPDLTNEEGPPTLGTASTAADLVDNVSNPRGTESIDLGANTRVPSLQAAGTTLEHTGQHTGELVTTDKSLSNLGDAGSNPRGTEPVVLGANTLVPSLQAAGTTPEHTDQHTGELVSTDKSLSNLGDAGSNPRGTEPVVLGANTLIPSLQAAGTTPEHTGQHTGELVTTDKSLSNLGDAGSNPRALALRRRLINYKSKYATGDDTTVAVENGKIGAKETAAAAAATKKSDATTAAKSPTTTANQAAAAAAAKKSDATVPVERNGVSIFSQEAAAAAAAAKKSDATAAVTSPTTTANQAAAKKSDDPVPVERNGLSISSQEAAAAAAKKSDATAAVTSPTTTANQAAAAAAKKSDDPVPVERNGVSISSQEAAAAKKSDATAAVTSPTTTANQAAAAAAAAKKSDNDQVAFERNGVSISWKVVLFFLFCLIFWDSIKELGQEVHIQINSGGWWGELTEMMFGLITKLKALFLG